ncbi:MAG TPA: YetF domain-containing protein [Vicinamibacterales bacterium]|nr:YetF domain-containing protein [Vicinamibacterales bacterium]
MNSGMFFQGWEVLVRTLLVGVLAYAGLVLFVRVSGKRTLSKMNAFDLIVTVALGSTLATILLSPDVALAEGLLALALLILLQYVVAWSAVRAGWFRGAVKSEPTLLFHEGRFLDTALRRERVTRAEVLAAARNQGVADLGEVVAVVLETDGSFSVLNRGAEGKGTSTLRAVRRLE